MKKLTAPTNQHFISVAKFGAPYGVKGWIKVHPNVVDQDYLLHCNPWYTITSEANPVPIVIAQRKKHGKALVVQIDPTHTREMVHSYTGKQIAVLREQLPPLSEGEYYWDDLIGLTVIQKNGHLLGKVFELMVTGANDVLIVHGDKITAIPYLRGTVILDINLNTKTITVDWDMD